MSVRIFISFSILLFLTSFSVSADELAIAEITKDKVIHQLTSSDWDSEPSANTTGCLIDVQNILLIQPAGPISIYDGCQDYKFREWEPEQDTLIDGSNTKWRILQNGRGRNTSFIIPIVTKFEDLPVIPSYIDVENFKKEFIKDVLLRYAQNNSSELDQQKKDDLYLIQRGDFPKLSIVLEDYKFPRGGGQFHYTKIFVSKNGVDIAIGEYWVRVYNLSTYKIIHKTMHFDNWFKNTANEGNRKIDVSKTFIGPYSTGSKYYFINESHGYESIWVKLLEYQLWGEGMDVEKVLVQWSYGC